MGMVGAVFVDGRRGRPALGVVAHRCPARDSCRRGRWRDSGAEGIGFRLRERCSAALFFRSSHYCRVGCCSDGSCSWIAPEACGSWESIERSFGLGQ